MNTKKKDASKKAVIRKRRPVKVDEKKKSEEIVIVNVYHRHHTMVSVFWTLVTFYAIYLSFERNKGLNVVSFLCALLFAPFYIIYAWVVPVQEGYHGLLSDVFLWILPGIITIISLFWWWQRRILRNGPFDGFVSFFFAFFFSFFYILYAMATHNQYDDTYKKISGLNN